VETLRALLLWASEHSVPVLLLGGGSNLLISDSGFDGLVIRTAMRGITEQLAQAGDVIVAAAAGQDWDAFVAHCVSRGLQGVECLSGIPGSVGASPIQNIGAYGQEVKDTIVSVDVIERATGEPRTFTNAECNFSYRMSRFKAEDRDKYVVVAVSFKLKAGGEPTLRYGDITRHFTTAGVDKPSLQQVRDAVLEIRARKAMVLDPAEPNSRSCGSFFMNPIVSTQQHEHVLEVLQRESLLRVGEEMPAFPAGDGAVKLSAAWLMERAGLKRGMQQGNVGLSEKHVLAIVNRGGGTAREVQQLVKIVQSEVQKKFGVLLEPEPVFIGFSSPSTANF
jgi:UDP-N-acetylmuramate dehydrogenase